PAEKDQEDTEHKENEEERSETEDLPIVFTKESRVKELKKELKKRGLKAKGNKKDLIAILNDYEKNRDRLKASYFCRLATPEPEEWNEGSVNGDTSEY
ncbi:MAG: hypothetical protein GY714_02825, partial [Desulfobacterales bacterium]|nr:hypothetical protein [Desulfobacterales bacterium]